MAPEPLLNASVDSGAAASSSENFNASYPTALGASSPPTAGRLSHQQQRLSTGAAAAAAAAAAAVAAAVAEPLNPQRPSSTSGMDSPPQQHQTSIGGGSSNSSRIAVSPPPRSSSPPPPPMAARSPIISGTEHSFSQHHSMLLSSLMGNRYISLFFNTFLAVIESFVQFNSNSNSFIRKNANYKFLFLTQIIVLNISKFELKLYFGFNSIILFIIIIFFFRKSAL